MFGLGGPKRPKMAAFDIIGTVFPLEPLRSSVMALGLPPAGLEGWFAAGCRDAFAMVAVGDYEPFTTVLEAALESVLAEQGCDAPADERKALVKHLETLNAREGAQEAFSILAEAGIPVMALSNGAKNVTKALLKRAGLSELVREIVSVDEVKLAKPRREVYLHAASKAGVEPGELALVAATLGTSTAQPQRASSPPILLRIVLTQPPCERLTWRPTRCRTSLGCWQHFEAAAIIVAKT